jgi:Protein of unknown function (DUF2950)
MLVGRLSGVVLASCVALDLAGGGTALADQERFAQPDAALQAFIGALGTGDPARLGGLFGPEHMDEILGDDPVAARADMAKVYADAERAAALRPAGADRMVVVVGREAWPFPVPLVRDADGWRFDAAAGAEEIADRRIGRNELAAIEVMRAYVDAQREYASEDHGGDGVLEYAQRIASTGDKRDGLYWPTAEGEAPSPFGPFVAEVGDYLEGRQAGAPYHGYYFRVLTGQGPNAPGGAYGYVINGHMVAGFAMLAWPATYDDTGVMSFLVGPNGVVLEADLGPDTAERARAITTYDPGPSWQPSTD